MRASTTIGASGYAWAVPLLHAIAHAPAHAAVAAHLGAQVRATPAAPIRTVRAWTSAGHRYVTSLCVPAAPAEAVPALAALLYGAAALPSQPWYASFLRGRVRPCPAPPAPGTRRHQLASATFDLGLGQPRTWHTLVSEVHLDAATRAVGLVSVPAEPEPDDGVVAPLLAPSGDVLHHDGDALHWHHVVVTPGVGLLPGAPDRWLLAALRGLGLDGQERATYRAEALGLVPFARDPEAACALAASVGILPL